MESEQRLGGSAGVAVSDGPLGSVGQEGAVDWQAGGVAAHPLGDVGRLARLVMVWQGEVQGTVGLAHVHLLVLGHHLHSHVHIWDCRPGWIVRLMQHASFNLPALCGKIVHWEDTPRAPVNRSRGVHALRKQLRGDFLER